MVENKIQIIIFIGPPGCGKGTTASRLQKMTRWQHISVGDKLREAVKKQTALTKDIKKQMEFGELVDDEFVIDIVQKQLSQRQNFNNIILDGFPRNLYQAIKLDEMIQKENLRINQVIEFQIKDQILLERICGRRIHEASGRTYHIKFNPPQVENIDDITGEKLIQRNDDREQTLIKRLDIYKKQTLPLKEFYVGRGIVREINADQSIVKVWQDLLSAISRERARL